ncbi:hypothetical protein [Micromonospora sp. WMMD812]|uniref:hypothetical protein n=1 Tax=Micromonospora sp. WMMD812 TaxID=3015152 RepID=UPI00248B28C2|nr:hypothetical protein [Micromonospora sp. WMMD812]WBB70096.1 hypothetical protein O7603_12330 [Micromonospora sp. WMMD812]
MTTTSRALLVTALFATATLPGCGTSNAPAAQAGPQDPAPTQPAATAAATTEPPAKTINPCELVSKPEAEKLAGTPLDDGQLVKETCTYTGPVTGPTAQVEIFVGDGAKKFLDIDRELKHEFTTLQGVGEEAYLEDGAAFIRKGTVWVSLRLVRLNDPAENRKPLTDLATTIATRL